MSNPTLFKERLLNLNESSNLQQWCDSANEIIGLYDLSDEKICQTILETIPHRFISSKAVKNIQAESYVELLQALQDFEFSKNCGKLFMELSNDDKMKPEKFQQLFDKLQGETRSAQDLKPFLAALALEKDYTKRKVLLEYLSTHPGATYEDAIKSASKD